MLRALFTKTGNAVWISHLDLMRLLCRAFQRAGLPLTHSQGFNSRPSVSIALPMSVGTSSVCELLDFDLEQPVAEAEIKSRLNAALIDGITVREVYSGGQKLGALALLEAVVTLEYDGGVPAGAGEAISGLFAGERLPVEKKSKNGPVEQDIMPMLRKIELVQPEDGVLELHALVQCQNPGLNPMQLAAAVRRYLPAYAPDFASCRRVELYTADEKIFR